MGTDNTMGNRKRTNNDLQNTTLKTKDRATRTPLNTVDELRTTCGPRCVTLVLNLIITNYIINSCQNRYWLRSIYCIYYTMIHALLVRVHVNIKLFFFWNSAIAFFTSSITLDSILNISWSYTPSSHLTNPICPLARA